MCSGDQLPIQQLYLCQRQFELPFTVTPDLSPQVTHIQTGDIVNLRGQISFGGDAISQTAELGKGVSTQGKSPSGPGSAPAPIRYVACLGCNQLIEADSVYCNYCRRPTGFPG